MMNKNYIYIFFSLLVQFGFSQNFTFEDGETATTCDGVLNDNGGGPGGTIETTPNEQIFTLCPDGDDLRVVLEFTTFFIDNSSGNYFEIHDGDDPDNDPLIGSFLGTLNANDELSDGIVASDFNSSGCLTIVMDINSAGIPGFESGFEADISCQVPCQIIFPEILDVQPSEISDDTYITGFSEEITFTGGGDFSDDFSEGAVYEWDFGDGNTATGQVVTHTYASLGEYQVTLSVTDANGCENVEVVQTNVSVTFDAGEAPSGCPNVETEITTTNIDYECYDGEPETVSIEADFLETGLTDQYRVESIDYNPPFPYEGLSNPISVNTDDVWSPNIQLPFDFCYFGDVQTEIKVGSNGIISFQNPSGTNLWDLQDSNPIPDNVEAMNDANIMLNHDMNPAVNNSDTEIAWEIIGEAPCRTFVVSFKDVAFFSCTEKKSTFMIVLYETTNAIDFYIENKPNGCSWNSDLAVLGIQNDSANQGYAPPNRNLGSWNAQNEAWRFVPDGEPNYEFQWLDQDGNFFSDEEIINVPVIDEDFYTAEIVYTNCNGDVIEETSESSIELEYAFEVLTEVEFGFCEGDSNTITSEIIPFIDEGFNYNNLNYQWFKDNEVIEGETEEELLVDEEGTYTVTVSKDNNLSCNESSSTIVEVYKRPEVEDSSNVEDFELCGDFTFSQSFDLTQNNENTLGLESPENVNTTYYLTEADADEGINSIENPENYNLPFGVDEQTIFIRLQNTPETGGCAELYSFNIKLLNVEIGTTPIPDIEECESNFENGEVFFDLTQQNELVLGPNQTIQDYSISYFEDLA
ncbi:PKD domain-containing protein, partial [Psychroflexus maritimus]